MHISLITGLIPVAVSVLTMLVLTVVLVRPTPGWARRVAVLAMVSAGTMLATALAIGRLHLFDFTFPWSFYAWVGLVVFAMALAVRSWAGTPVWRRMTAGVAVLLTAIMAATQINLHYGYYPTLAAVLGRLATDEISRKQFVEEAASAAPAPRPERGRVIAVDIPATVSGFPHRPALVYLPPAWFEPRRPALPTILMLPGTPGLTADWTRAGAADQTADAYADAHRGQAPILVFADPNGSDTGDTECVDSPLGRAETYLTVDVRTWVTSTYGTSPGPNRWAVAGLSEGGTCAIELALRHPDLFHSFADFSGDLGPTLGTPASTVGELFGGSRSAWQEHDPLTILSRRRFPQLSGWFEAGTGDPERLAAARRLEAAARAAGADTQLVVRDGTHNFAFWTAAFQHALPWLAERLGLPDPGGPGPPGALRL